MTQLYRIEKQDMDVEEATRVIREWGMHNVCYAEMIHNENITEGEAVQLAHYGPRGGCYQFAAIYRKNDHNYIWRGRRVPDKIKRRLTTLLANTDPDNQKQGTMLLYKTGGNSRVNNRAFYPIRLSDNRYSFQMGSLAGLGWWMDTKYNSDSLSDERQALDSIFNMWKSEHLLDEVPSGYDAIRSFNRRAKMTFLMDQFINTDEYKELYSTQGVIDSEDSIFRATHCVWKDGEIIEWQRCGQNIHPKI